MEDNKLEKEKIKYLKKKEKQRQKKMQYAKEYNQRPEVKERIKEYKKNYAQIPEVKEKAKAYKQQPEFKEGRKILTECECGGHYRSDHKQRHLRTNKHLKTISA